MRLFITSLLFLAIPLLAADKELERRQQADSLLRQWQEGKSDGKKLLQFCDKMPPGEADGWRAAAAQLLNKDNADASLALSLLALQSKGSADRYAAEIAKGKLPKESPQAQQRKRAATFLAILPLNSWPEIKFGAAASWGTALLHLASSAPDPQMLTQCQLLSSQSLWLPGKAQAGLAAGMIYCSQKEWVKARDSIRFATGYAGDLLSSDGKVSVVHLSVSDKILLGALRQDAARHLAWIEEILDMEQYGSGWVLWRDADVLARDGKSDESIVICDELIQNHGDTVYGEAARLLRLRLLLKLAKELAPPLKGKAPAAPEIIKADEAPTTVEARERMSENRRLRKGLVARGEQARRIAFAEKTEFCSSSPSGLGRDEVRLDFGIFLLEEGKLHEAAKEFEAGIEASGRIEAAQALFHRFAVPGKAQEKARAPEQRQSRDRLGNIVQNQIPPGSIVNCVNCPWYLSWIRAQLMARKGFCLFAQGKYVDAKALFQSMEELDGAWKEASKALYGPSAPKRLMACCDDHYLQARPEELKGFDARTRLSVQWADFIYTLGDRWDDARGHYEAILKDGRGCDKSARAYLHFAIGCCYYWRCSREGFALAVAEWEQAATAPGTESRKRALLSIACQANQMEEKALSRGICAAEELLAEDRDQDRKEQVLAILVNLNAMTGHCDIAKSWLKKLTGSDQYKFAAERLQGLEAKAQAQEDAAKNQHPQQPPRK